jgi:hypothetical protein
MRIERLGLALAVAAATSAYPAAAQTDDAAAGELVAIQVREQGLACADPVSAKRDPAADDDAVWTLTCADASYRVRLIPDQAAKVEKLD